MSLGIQSISHVRSQVVCIVLGYPIHITFLDCVTPEGHIVLGILNRLRVARRNDPRRTHCPGYKSVHPTKYFDRIAGIPSRTYCPWVSPAFQTSSRTYCPWVSNHYPMSDPKQDVLSLGVQSKSHVGPQVGRIVLGYPLHVRP